MAPGPGTRLLLAALLFSSAPLPATGQTATFTVKAGERVQDWCRRLEAEGVLTCRAVLHLAANAAYDSCAAIPPPAADRLLAPRLNRRRNPFEGNRFEGAFPPGTYRATGLAPLDGTDTTAAIGNAQKVIDLLVEAAGERCRSRPSRKKLSTRQEWVMASIVQKEAVAGEDLDRVAAVFHNRLARDDRFGSCPTVEYALGYHRPFLLHKDLESVADSPYNLYRQKGLPPTPIAFFSDGALDAVRAPAADDSLYFFVYDWVDNQLLFAPLDGYDAHRRNAAQVKNKYRIRHGDIRRLFPDRFYE